MFQWERKNDAMLTAQNYQIEMVFQSHLLQIWSNKPTISTCTHNYNGQTTTSDKDVKPESRQICFFLFTKNIVLLETPFISVTFRRVPLLSICANF